jgi:DNA-binding NarL/FixJ family response regulator
VLELLSTGLSNKRIARELEISEITVKAHVSAIFRKLGVTNRTQAGLEARRLLDPNY